MSEARLATYNRQKAINLLEKITKNMYRMFRNEETTLEELSERFFHLHKQLESLGDVVLNGEYHHEMKLYIENLSHVLQHDIDLDSIRGENMTALNRIQKIRNGKVYKRKAKNWKLKAKMRREWREE